MSTTAFHPVRERVLSFRGIEIVTADLKDGQGYVSINSLCDAFGLERSGQRQRLTRRNGYFEPYTATILLQTPGGPQSALCLMASAVPLFLSGVQFERVQNPEARDLLQTFLDEAHVVLSEHFGISERGELRFIQDAIARMVAEQEVFEDTLSKKVEAELAEIRQAHEDKVQQIREAFSNLRQQVVHLDAVAAPKSRLTPEQSGQLRQLVNTLGLMQQEDGVANPYQAIYMNIFRMTGVGRSEDIRKDDFPAVTAYLEQQIAAMSKRLKK